MAITRRELLKAAGASWILSQAGCPGFLAPDRSDKDLIGRQDNPYNAEPRLDQLAESFVTPFKWFYVRSHGNQPEVNPDHYALLVEGLVDRPLRLRMDDLERFAKVTTVATMQCAGNRRSEHSRTKTTGGVQWDAGAIGTGEWRGPRLSDLLERAGLKPGAKHVWFEGMDSVTLKDRQTLFGGGVPLEKAMRPETMLALEMNGLPLSREHGYPARTVVPGYIGARSVKWLGRIIVADKPSENNFVARDYKLFPPEATPETVKPENYEPIYEFVLASAICSPLVGAILSAGKTEVVGYAVPPGSGDAWLGTVEVSGDGGATWKVADWIDKDAPFAWKRWKTTLDLQPGARTLIARAKDSRGQLQPEKAPWNFKGYLYNGWHRVPVTVS
ncbi:MAG: sulfite oxidase [Planctomycetaceae bacterium]|nr:sulfite oxidase [Planctomycetaceae bacterium]